LTGWQRSSSPGGTVAISTLTALEVKAKVKANVKVTTGDARKAFELGRCL
jgi:hypothetical protein